MSPHAYVFKPSPQRPVVYRTGRAWWQRWAWLLALVWVAVVGGAAVLGVTTVIARMHATDAQLERAFLEGLKTGQQICRGG